MYCNREEVLCFVFQDYIYIYIYIYILRHTRNTHIANTNSSCFVLTLLWTCNVTIDIIGKYILIRCIETIGISKQVASRIKLPKQVPLVMSHGFPSWEKLSLLVRTRSYNTIIYKNIYVFFKDQVTAKRMTSIFFYLLLMTIKSNWCKKKDFWYLHKNMGYANITK